MKIFDLRGTTANEPQLPPIQNKSTSYKIQQIAIHGCDNNKAILYVIEDDPLALSVNPTVVMYCIPISIEKLHELDINVGSHITLEIKPEGK